MHNNYSNKCIKYGNKKSGCEAYHSIEYLTLVQLDDSKNGMCW